MRKDNRQVALQTPHSGGVKKSSNNSNSNSNSASSSRNRSGVSSNVGHNKELAAVPDSRLVHTERSHFGR